MVNSFKISIKQAIFVIFSITVLLFLSLTLLTQYYFSQKIIEESTKTIIEKISENISTRLEINEERVKNGINLIELFREEKVDIKEGELHPSTEKMAIFMANNPFTLALYYGYRNGNFFEVINLNIDSGVESKIIKKENEAWLVIKIIEKDGKRVKIEEYLDDRFNLLRSEKIENNNFEPINRPWYNLAIKNDKIIKTAPYLFDNIKSLGITYAKKIDDNIVLGIDIALSTLSSFFDEQININNSHLFLINKNDRKIVATNNLTHVRKIAEIYKEIDNKSSSVKLDNEDYFITTNNLTTNIGLEQELILLTPKNEAYKEFQDKVVLGLIATAIFFIIILPFVLYLINLLIKPISQLIIENEKIINKDYDNVQIVNTRLKELKSLSKSLYIMSKSIKEYKENQDRFVDGFISMISKAIDDKSPYTGGHCHKIPIIMNLIVEAASKSQDEVFKEFRNLTKEEIRQIEVAAKLHDCGKITTPEYVMDKSVKLETIYNRIHEIRTRFEVIYRDLKIKALENLVKNEDKIILEKDLQIELNKLQNEFAFIAQCNIGSEFLSNDAKDKIQNIAKKEWTRYFDDSLGLSNEEKKRYIKPISNQEYLLDDKINHIVKREFFDFAEFEKFGFKMEVPNNLYNFGEIYNLCIEKGTINKEERFKINEHITATIKMLESLPFPKNLSKVTEFAGNHHETLIGTGYPRKLTKNEMSLTSRMMAVADIFEALSANDRPYKDTKKLSEVLKIMSYFVKDRHIDEDVFKLFVEEKIYLKYANNHLKKEQIDLENIEEVLKNL